MASTISILIVEDESFILRSILHVLRKRGHEPLAARDGEEACRLVREARPDVVFLDVMMPRMNGYDVCRYIKADPELKDTHVVLLTAKGQRADRETGLAAGADDYVVKPFGVAEILERVDRIAARRAASRRHA